MKIYLIAVLFLTALVAVPCLAEEETYGDEPMVNGRQQLADEDESGPPVDGVDSDEEADEEADEEGDEQDEEEINNHPSIPEEIKDEVQDALKRRVPRLSARCCVVLKRYGFCKNRIIRRLCAPQCRPPPCKNLISPRSCLLVRNKYKRCRLHIGRVYCRRTCGYCRPVKPKWVTRTPFWCGTKNRTLIKYRVTLKKCQELCLKRRGCKAVEWWGKYNFACFHCHNPKLMKPYTNKKDLAYPPHVSVYTK